MIEDFHMMAQIKISTETTVASNIASTFKIRWNEDFAKQTINGQIQHLKIFFKIW